MKKEYTKPTMKEMELTYNDVICASIYASELSKTEHQAVRT